MKNRKKRNGIVGSTVGVVVLIGLLLFQNQVVDFENEGPATTVLPVDDVVVEYLDVGQADAVLIRSGRKTMLIDAGNNEDGPLLAAYLKAQGISTIDVLIGTHPHEDHIGGMDNVIRAFSVDKFILPDVVTTTKTFTSVLDAAEKQNLKVVVAKPGMTWELEEAACEVLCCKAVHENELNEWSVVVRMVFGNTSFLFTGDEEAVNEQLLLKSGYDISADILKCPHHGSDTSSTAAFIREVSPKTVILSVGKDNDYGLPAAEVLHRYTEIGAEVYRTDLQGTIVVESNGDTYTVQRKNTETDG